MTDTNKILAVWDFTLSKLDREIEDIRPELNSLFKKWVCQEEKGDSGYLHFQGRGSLWKRRRLNEVLSIIKMSEIKELHISPTVTENMVGEPFYCLKADTRVAGPFRQDDPEARYIPRQYRGMLDSLYPYQQKIFDSATDFDSRSINFIYDPCGAKGKSTIASLCALYGRGIQIPAVNDAEKLIASVCDILRSKDDRTPGVIFVDMPRAMDKRHLSGVYTAIEEIKKGFVYDLRYSYKEWWFDSPAVWVFANIPPDLSLLSRDRWRLWTISEDKDLDPYDPMS